MTLTIILSDNAKKHIRLNWYSSPESLYYEVYQFDVLIQSQSFLHKA